MQKEQFHQKINNYYKNSGLPVWPAAPVIHQGFPGNFNLSLTEYEFIHHNENFMDLKSDINYHKTQPAIRYNDFVHIKKQDEDAYRYLLSFNIAPVGGIYWEKDLALRQQRVESVIKNTIGFMVNECNFDPKKIHVKYLKGGKISEITCNKYTLDKYIPKDPNLKIYQSLGISKENLISASDRDALLALNVYGRPTPWGYRNEIFYEYKGKLLDVGTVESLIYRPLYDHSNNLIDLIDYEYVLEVGAIGLERVLMVINNFDSVNELDIIADPAKILRSYLDPTSATGLVQTLRTVCLIVADGGTYENLEKRRKEKMRDFLNYIWQIIQKNNLPKEIFNKLIEEIADKELSTPQIKDNISLIQKEFALLELRKKYDKRWHEHLDEIK